MTATRLTLFTVVFAYNGVVYRDVCDWSDRAGAADKAKRLRKVYGKVAVSTVAKAAGLPTIA